MKTLAVIPQLESLRSKLLYYTLSKAFKVSNSVKGFPYSGNNSSQDISSGLDRLKLVLLVGEEVVLIQVFDDILTDYRLEKYTDDTEETDGSILRRGKITRPGS